jgi:hypothetical protein
MNDLEDDVRYLIGRIERLEEDVDRWARRCQDLEQQIQNLQTDLYRLERR